QRAPHQMPARENAIVGTSTLVAPPSTGSTAPVTYEARDDARNAMTSATSAGSAGRPSGTSRVTSAYASARPASPAAWANSSISASAIGVRTQPGQTAFARTPSSP